MTGFGQEVWVAEREPKKAFVSSRSYDKNPKTLTLGQVLHT